jgi:hypothetical protein
MPRGPGINKFDALLGELMQAGAVETEQVQQGNFTGFVFHLLPDAPSTLGPDEIAAVKTAVASVDGKTANHVSESSHEQSRAWQLASDGDELDVFWTLSPRMSTGNASSGWKSWRGC